jgi:putative transcriptional regulator
MDLETKSTTPLKDLRIKSGKTQYEVALLVGVRPQTVSLWERGEKEPRLHSYQFVLLCEIYGCSMSELDQAIKETVQNSDSNGRMLLAS